MLGTLPSHTNPTQPPYTLESNSDHCTNELLYDKLKLKLMQWNHHHTDPYQQINSIDQLEQYITQHNNANSKTHNGMYSLYEPVLLQRCDICNKQVLESVYEKHHNLCSRAKHEYELLLQKQSSVSTVSAMPNKPQQKLIHNDASNHKSMNDKNTDSDTGQRNKSISPARRTVPTKTVVVPPIHNTFQSTSNEYIQHNKLLQRMISYIPSYYRDTITSQVSSLRELLFCTSTAPFNVNPLHVHKQPIHTNPTVAVPGVPARSPVVKSLHNVTPPAGSSVTSRSPQTYQLNNDLIQQSQHRASLMLPPDAPAVQNNTMINNNNIINNTTMKIAKTRKPRAPKSMNGTAASTLPKTSPTQSNGKGKLKRKLSEDSIQSIDVSSPNSVNTHLTPNGSLTPKSMLAYPIKQLPVSNTSQQQQLYNYHNINNNNNIIDRVHTPNTEQSIHLPPQIPHNIYDNTNNSNQPIQRNTYSQSQTHPQSSPQQPHRQQANYNQQLQQQHQMSLQPQQQSQQLMGAQPMYSPPPPQSQHNQRHTSNGYATMPEIANAVRSNNSNPQQYNNTSIDWSTISTNNISSPAAQSNNYSNQYNTNNNNNIGNINNTNHNSNSYMLPNNQVPQNTVYNNPVMPHTRTISDNINPAQIPSHQSPHVRTGSADHQQQISSQHNRMANTVHNQPPPQQTHPQPYRQAPPNQTNYQPPPLLAQKVSIQQQRMQPLPQQQQYQQHAQQQQQQQRYQPVQQ